MQGVLHLIIDSAHSGSWNMALDEALLEQAEATGTATLRFYQWQQPTLSLGYFQSHRERESHAASIACPLVRRASGGGALVHDRELTYSFAAPMADRLAGDVEQLYYAFHETLVAALTSWNVTAHLYRGTPSRAKEVEPFLCFQRRAVGDCILGVAKILGSAQRRRRGAVLQHGGILLRSSPHAPELPGIAELAGVEIPPAELIAAWLPLLEQRLQMHTEPADVTGATSELARRIEAEKFAHAKWTERR